MPLRRPLRRLALALLVPLALAPHACARAGDADTAVLVLAAASTVDALDDAIAAFTSEHGIDVRASYGATSTLARQVAAGAPAALFLSASVEWVDWVEERARVQARGVVAGNQLVVVEPAAAGAGAAGPPPPAATAPTHAPDAVGRDDAAATTPPSGARRTSTDDAVELLSRPELQRIALADPTAVPAGRYARQALEALGLWERLQPRLVPTLDVRAALALAARREVDAAIVYRSDAAASDAVVIAAELDTALHEPIAYPVLLLGGAGDAAQRFFDWLTSEPGRRHFLRRGFLPPPAGR